jgi:hypothetical protein
MYQRQAQETPPGAEEGEPAAQPAGGQADEDVVEADYEIVDEEK